MMRLATMNDIDALNDLVKISARVLSHEDYSTEKVEALIEYVFGVDSQLIVDQTYFMIEQDGKYMACGGWSRRKTLFGGNQCQNRNSALLNPKIDAAKIRAFFVNPEFARLGLGKKLLHHCEQMALAHGFTKTEIMATLPGIRLYQACGYTVSHINDQLLPNGISVQFKHMYKNLLINTLSDNPSDAPTNSFGDLNMKSRYPQSKLTIVGGGIIGALEAYYAFMEAKNQGKQIRITIFEKNKSLSETTTANIVPSLTPDEILSVVPRGPMLVEKLGILFNQPGGIRVDDVAGVNESSNAQKFIAQVQQYSKDDAGHAARTKALMALGKMSMELWQSFYNNADSELKEILKASNFNPCRELKDTQNQILHDGYRVDLIYNVPNAKLKAEGMQQAYQSIGYANCKLLSPAAVKKLDPFLATFCDSHAEFDRETGEEKWLDDAVALYRPGGCIDTEVFLPKFYIYLTKMMGQYVNDTGQIKNCFHIKFERNVLAVAYENDSLSVINGLRFFNDAVRQNKHAYKTSDYVFCPGEAIGTLERFGFNEPAYAGFAGASLMLNIPVPAEKCEQYKKFNHCMEVHQEGVVLAWQARFKDNKIFIGVAGTKAFYSDQKPHKGQSFAKDRNLLQLNMVNDVLPEFISLALGRNTKGQKLTELDLKHLEDNKIAKRWVGTRAVAYDGFPTLGALFNVKGKVANARCTTHLGSGGASFSPGAVSVSRNTMNPPSSSQTSSLIEDVIKFADTRRQLR